MLQKINDNGLRQSQLLYEVAGLYYEEGLTQAQIATEIGVSRPQVQKLLKRARERGIVRIQVINPVQSYRELEDRLEKHFKLNKAIVVSSGIDNENIIRNHLGKATAGYLAKVVSENEIIGVGLGRTIYEVLKHFKPIPGKSMTCVPLMGGIGRMAGDFQVNEMARQFAEKTGGAFVPFHAPALSDGKHIADLLFTDTKLNEAVRLWNKVTTAIVGIGEPLSDVSYVPIDYYGKEDIPLLRKSGCVGDILSHFINREGKLCSPVLSQRVVGISLDKLRRIKRVIVVAGSMRKKETILAALRGRLIKVLVTDEHVAEEILMNDDISRQ